eukprot:6238528-Prymnesium_polylepis.3
MKIARDQNGTVDWFDEMIDDDAELAELQEVRDDKVEKAPASDAVEHSRILVPADGDRRVVELYGKVEALTEELRARDEAHQTALCVRDEAHTAALNSMNEELRKA